MRTYLQKTIALRLKDPQNCWQLLWWVSLLSHVVASKLFITLQCCWTLLPLLLLQKKQCLEKEVSWVHCADPYKKAAQNLDTADLNFLKSFDSLGIPDTSFRGLSTRTALRVRKSKSEPIVDRILQGKKTDTQMCAQLIYIHVIYIVPAC